MVRAWVTGRAKRSQVHRRHDRAIHDPWAVVREAHAGTGHPHQACDPGPPHRLHQVVGAAPEVRGRSVASRAGGTDHRVHDTPTTPDQLVHRVRVEQVTRHHVDVLAQAPEVRARLLRPPGQHSHPVRHGRPLHEQTARSCRFRR